MLKTFTDIVPNTFGELTFIGGTHKQLLFYLNTYSGSPIRVDYNIAEWSLTPYNAPEYVVLTKYPNRGNGYCQLELLSTDTENLSGKYTQILSLTGVTGHEYNVGRGIINILPRIGIEAYG